jgi:predicted proteasome-type protease
MWFKVGILFVLFYLVIGNNSGYNLMGQRVLNIVNQRQDAGSHKVLFSIPTQFSVGMYIGRLVTENVIISSQIIVS